MVVNCVSKSSQPRTDFGAAVWGHRMQQCLPQFGRGINYQSFRDWMWLESPWNLKGICPGDTSLLESHECFHVFICAPSMFPTTCMPRISCSWPHSKSIHGRWTYTHMTHMSWTCICHQHLESRCKQDSWSPCPTSISWESRRQQQPIQKHTGILWKWFGSTSSWKPSSQVATPTSGPAVFLGVGTLQYREKNTKMWIG